MEKQEIHLSKMLDKKTRQMGFQKQGRVK